MSISRFPHDPVAARRPPLPGLGDRPRQLPVPPQGAEELPLADRGAWVNLEAELVGDLEEFLSSKKSPKVF